MKNFERLKKISSLKASNTHYCCWIKSELKIVWSLFAKSLAKTRSMPTGICKWVYYSLSTIKIHEQKLPHTHTHLKTHTKRSTFGKLWNDKNPLCVKGPSLSKTQNKWWDFRKLWLSALIYFPHQWVFASSKPFQAEFQFIMSEERNILYVRFISSIITDKQGLPVYNFIIRVFEKTFILEFNILF